MSTIDAAIIKHITEGSNGGSGSSGGDTMTRVSGQTSFIGTARELGGMKCMYINNIPQECMKTGLIIKLRNTKTDNTITWVLIRKVYDITTADINTFTSFGKGNAVLLSLDDDSYMDVAIGFYNSAPVYTIRIENDHWDIPDENYGAFDIDHMSHDTLVKIMRHYYSTLQ